MEAILLSPAVYYPGIAFSFPKLLMPGLDNTRLFMSLTAGAGTRCMSLLSSPPSLHSSFLILVVKAWEGEGKTYKNRIS